MIQSWRPSVLRSPLNIILEKALILPVGPAAPSLMWLWQERKWNFVREVAVLRSGEGAFSFMLSLWRVHISHFYMFGICVLSWENKDMYARAVRSLRLKELQNTECMTAVRAGLSSIIPLQLLTMLTPLEMELRTCGLPHINLEFLKVCANILNFSRSIITNDIVWSDYTVESFISLVSVHTHPTITLEMWWVFFNWLNSLQYTIDFNILK